MTVMMDNAAPHGAVSLFIASFRLDGVLNVGVTVSGELGVLRCSLQPAAKITMENEALYEAFRSQFPFGLTVR